MMSLSKTSLPSVALFLAFILYGLFSSPTPDVISWAEIAIGLCLLVAAGAQNLAMVFSGIALWRPPAEKQFLSGCLLLLLVPPALNGVLSGYAWNDILRDIIPLGFLFLPLFLYARTPASAILYGLVFTGVLFALRFWPASGLTLARFGLDRGNDEMLYLTSSPAVMFAGLYLLFWGTELTPRRLLYRMIALLLSAICLLTLVATLQRGALVLAALSVFFVFLHRARRSPHFLYLCLAALCIGGIFLAPTLADIVALIWRKTLEVGDNARLAELATVIHAIGGDSLHWIFGLGWGAKVTTAASGYAEVRYTHMLFSYALFKGGLIGLLAMAAYGVWAMRQAIRNLPHFPMQITAALPAIILGFSVYPSFKMLCFGAILVLITQRRPHETD